MLEYKLYPASSGNVLYIILPEGLAGECQSWLESVSLNSGWNIAAITGPDWNNDLTPWPAPGMFRKEKPFGGKAQAFLELFTKQTIPAIEGQLLQGRECSQRALAGVSLSGLFAAWAGVSCDCFQAIGCISGSFWFDGFAEWFRLNAGAGSLKKAFILLGEREKESRNPRLATVQGCTSIVVDTLIEKGVEVRYELDEGTHFSPVLPRLERMATWLL